MWWMITFIIAYTTAVSIAAYVVGYRTAMLDAEEDLKDHRLRKVVIYINEKEEP